MQRRAPRPVPRFTRVFSIAWSALYALSILLTAPASVLAAAPAKPVLAFSAATPTLVSGPNPPSVAQTSTYSTVFTISNTGNADATSPTASIPLGASATLVSKSSSSGTTAGTTTVTWTGAAALAAGASVTITLRVSVAPTLADVGANIVLEAAATASALDGTRAISASSTAVTVGPVAGNNLPTCSAASLTVNEDTAGTLALGCSDADGQALTYSIGTQPSKGTASVNATGTLSFTPSADLNGADSVIVAVSDGIGTTNKTITITITAVNDAPRCTAASLTVNEDTVGTISVPCTDPEGATINWTLGTPAKGAVTVTGSGTTLTYTPNANATGSDSFSVTASDGSLSASTTITISITAINDLPTCNAASITSAEDTAGSVTLVCSDIEGSSLSYSVPTQPVGGTASVSNRGVVTFTPSADWNGSTTVVVAVSDGTGAANISVSVTITPVNDAPRCSATTVTTDEDTVASINPPCVDPEGATLTWTLGTPSKGTVSVVNGQLVYTPNANANGVDSFTVSASDGSLSGSLTINVTINAINDAPVCQTLSLSGLEDNNLSGSVSCTDVEGDRLSYSIGVAPGSGSASVGASSGGVTFTPSADWNGTQSFIVAVSDGTTSTNATVNTTLSAVNDAPRCSAANLTTSEDTAGSATLSCNDPEGSPLIYSLTALPANGTASLSVSGTLSFTPSANWNGSTSATVAVSDGSLSTNLAVSIAVTAVNDAPVCTATSLTATEDTAASKTVVCSDVDGDSLSYSISVAPGNGTASVSAAGLVSYTPGANYSGSDSLTVRATDGTLSATALLTITVSPVNDAPVCSNRSITTAEDTSGSVSISCSDVDNANLSYSVTLLPANGTLSLGGGSVSFAPDADWNGSNSATVSASDGLLSATFTVSITVSAVNDAPRCSGLALLTDEDTAGSLLLGCTDPEGSAVSYTLTGQGAKGTSSLKTAAGKTTLTYTPNANANGSDTVALQVSDGTASTAANLAITITPVNDAPVCLATSLSVNEDTAGTKSISCSDVDGDTLAYEIGSAPSKGAASVSAAALLSYTPNANANGADSLVVQASDGTLTSSAAVSISIASVNDAPVCSTLTLSTSEDTAGQANSTCTDPDGDTLTYTQVSAPANGLLSIAGSAFTFTPAADWNGTTSAILRASDGTLVVDFTLSITVSAVNDAPRCSALTLSGSEDTAKSGTVACTDPEGTSVTLSIPVQPANGTAALSGNTLTFTPSADWNGTTSVTVRASDGSASSNLVVAVNISAVNDAPVCISASLTVNEDTAGTKSISCSDADGDTLAYSISTAPTKGAASMSGATLTYTPNANANGSDSLAVRASDGLLSATAAVSVTVAAINDAPVCTNRAISTAEDTQGSTAITCSDVDGDPLAYGVSALPANGVISLGGTNASFTPDADWSGSNTATLTSSDGTATTTFTLSISVSAVNDAPRCDALALSSAEDTQGSLVLACADPEGSAVTYTLNTNPANGTASISRAGSIYTLRYTPNVDWNGSDSLTVSASDGTLSSTGTVAVTVTPVNDAPLCQAASLATSEDAATSSKAISCTDVDGDTLVYSITTAPTKGSASVNASGLVSYTPNANTNGSDSLVVRASDGALAATATLSITISAVNDAPNCTDTSLAVAEDTAGSKTVVCTDIDGDTLAYSITTAPTKGTASVSNAGLVSYTPNANINGSDSLVVRASDGILTASATLSITISAVNDAPSCTNRSITTAEDTQGSTTITCTDPESDAISYGVSVLPANGTLAIGGTTASFTPDADWNGSNTATLTASDGALSTSFTVSITVTPVNDAPRCSAMNITTAEDTAGSLLLACTDPEGSAVGYAITGQGVKGFADLKVAASKTTLTYTPNANANGSDTVGISASDGTASAGYAVAVTISAVNDAPVCADATLTVAEDGAGSQTVSCADPDGDTLSYSIGSAPTKGLASVNPAGLVSYTPSANANGADSLTVRASDGTLASTAVLSITISAVNDAPACVDLTLSTLEDTQGSTSILCSDVDGDALTYSTSSAPANGALSFSGTSVRYTPAANTNGTDSALLRASDGVLSTTFGLAVTVTPVNDAPTCSAAALTVSEDTAGSTALSCTDVEGGTLAYSLATAPAKGSGSLSGSRFAFAPTANLNGADSAIVRVSDGSLTADLPITITISAVNDAPVCLTASLTTAEDTQGSASVTCSDVDGDALTYTVSGAPTRGVASMSGATLRYMPTANLNGADSLIVRASDSLLSATTTVAITVSAINDAPVCSDRSLTTDEDVPGSAVISCSDVDGDTLTYGLTTLPAHGVISVGPDAITFVPDADYAPSVDYNGTDSALLRASDGVLSTAFTLSITVRPVNDAPRCTALGITTDEDTAGTIELACTDPEGDEIGYTVSIAPSKGAATIKINGSRTSLRYAPSVDLNGADSLSISASDGRASSNHLVSVAISPVNDAPVCDAFDAALDEDTSTDLAPLCSDVDGDTLSYTVSGAPTNGQATLTGGLVTYRPRANYNGSDRLTVTASDGRLSRGEAVNLTVRPVADDPVCEPIDLEMNEDGSITFTPVCSDPDGDTVGGAIERAPGHGKGQKKSDSTLPTFTYTPDPNWVGTEEMGIGINDGTGRKINLPARIRVRAVNDAPVCETPDFSTLEDVRLKSQIVCSDPDGDNLFYEIVDEANNGRDQVSGGNGQFWYAPWSDWNGTESIIVAVSDRQLVTRLSFPVAVIAVVDAPRCNSYVDNENTHNHPTPDHPHVVSDSTNPGSSIGESDLSTITSSGSDYDDDGHDDSDDEDDYLYTDSCDTSLTTPEDTSDTVSAAMTSPDGATITYTIGTDPAFGSATVDANGIVTYVPGPDYNGADELTVLACVGSLCTPVLVHITVTPVDDEPVCEPASITTEEDTASDDVVLDCVDNESGELTYELTSGPSHGTLTIDPDGTLHYTPDPDYNGEDSVTIRVCDATGTCIEITVPITVTPINDTPVCEPSSITTQEDTSSDDVVLDCSDADGDELTYELTSGPSHGTLTIDPDGTLHYTPDPNYNGPDEVTIRVCDSSGACTEVVVPINVTPVNDEPVCEPAAITTEEDTANDEVVLDCSDLDGDTLTYEPISGPSHGTLTIDPDGTLHYTPDPNYNGEDSVTIQVCDPSGECFEVVVPITVTPVNDTPVCESSSITTPEDTADDSVVLDCSDVDGDALTYELTDEASNGELTVDPDGTLHYTPDSNYNGPDEVTVLVCDPSGECVEVVVPITVTPVNDAPVCDDEAISTPRDTADWVQMNCSDIDGDELTYSIKEIPDHGTSSINQDGRVDYTPDPGYVGPDALLVEVSDGELTGTGQVGIGVDYVNDPPVCDPLSLETDEDVEISDALSCSDPNEGDVLDYTLISGPSHGTLTVDPDTGELVYTPDPGYNGPDEVRIRVSDGSLTTVVTVPITVNPINDQPVCADRYISTPEETAKSATVTCSDPDGDTLSYEISAQPEHGTAEITSGSTVRYTPEKDFTGEDQLDLEASDGELMATGTVYITVTPINDAPICLNIASTGDEDTVQLVTVSCSDPDGDTLSYTVSSAPTRGTATNAANLVTYNPNLNYNGTDRLRLRASDGTLSAVGIVDLTITPANDAPTCQNATIVTPEDTAKSATIRCADIDGDTLTYSVASDPSNGGLTQTGTTARYTPNTNYNGSDLAYVRASDGQASAQARVDITVTPVNDAPVCANAAVTTPEDTLVTANLPCTDPDGDALSWTVRTQPGNGTIGRVLNAPLATAYLPNQDYNGLDVYNLTVTDGQTNVVSRVDVTVTPVNDAPVCLPASIVTDEDVPAGVSVSCSDIDGDTLSYSMSDRPANGGMTQSTTRVDYTPNLNYNGSDAAAVQAFDGQASAIAPVSILVRPLNDAPICTPTALVLDEDTSAVGALGCTDPDGNATLTYTVNRAPTNGAATQARRYTPSANYSGPDSAVFGVSDGVTNTNVTLPITVRPINDAPVCGPLAAIELIAGGSETRTMSCTDIEGDPLTYRATKSPKQGSVTLAGTVATYSAKSNGAGADSFTLVASDGQLDSNAVPVPVTITGIDIKPISNQNFDAGFKSDDNAYTIIIPAEGTQGGLNLELGGADASITLDGKTIAVRDFTFPSSPGETHIAVVTVRDAKGNVIGTYTFTFIHEDAVLPNAPGATPTNDPAPVSPDGNVGTLTPEQLATQGASGFAPNSAVIIEVIGARTFAAVALPADLAGLDEAVLEESLNRSSSEQASDFAAAQSFDVQDQKPVGAKPEDVTVPKDDAAFFEESGIGAARTLTPAEANSNGKWIEMTADLSTYTAGTNVYLVATSEPLVFGTAVVGADGRVSLSGAIPAKALGEGLHRFRVVGKRDLGGVTANADGSIAISDATLAEIKKFDEGTTAKATIKGEGANGGGKTLVRFIPLGREVPWWLLFFPVLTWLVLALLRRYGRPRALRRFRGLLIAEAVFLGVAFVTLLTAWSLLAFEVIYILLPLTLIGFALMALIRRRRTKDDNEPQDPNENLRGLIGHIRAEAKRRRERLSGARRLAA